MNDGARGAHQQPGERVGDDTFKRHRGPLVGEILFVLLLVVLAIGLRVPLMANADGLMDSDAAFNALSVKHLLRGDAFFLYYPGQDYQGITEGVLGVLLTRWFGWSSLAYHSSSLLFYLAYVVTIYLLTREAFGRSPAAMAACLAAFAAPFVLKHSMTALGGHVFVPLAGALMAWFLFRYESSRRPSWLYGLALTAGLSYYTYKLSAVVIAPAFVYLAYRSAVTWRSGARVRRAMIAGFAIWLLVGLTPLIAARLCCPPTSRPVAVGVAKPAQRSSNCTMLWRQALPDVLGYATPRRLPRRPADRFAATAVPRFLGAVYGAAFVYLLVRIVRREAGLLLFPKGGVPSREATLLLFLASPLVAFCLSNYVTDRNSARYLLPVYVAFPPLIAFALSRLARLRLRVLAWAVVLALCFANVWGGIVFCRKSGFLSKRGWSVVRVSPAPREAARYLLDQGVTRAYGSYWIAYLMTFLTDERLIVAPYGGLNERKPPDYGSIVREEPNPPYVFLGIDRQLRRDFLRRMEKDRVPLTERRFDGFKGGIFVYMRE
ncbi:MAG: glycosyltransferase family 39 protein [Verrucomicrobiota bacterium]